MERGIRIREDMEPYVHPECSLSQDFIDAPSDDDAGDRELESMIAEQKRLAPY